MKTVTPRYFFLLPVLALFFATSRVTAQEADLKNRYPDMVYIPAGYVEMGSDQKDIDRAMDIFREVEKKEPIRNWFDDEVPKHKAWVRAFYMDKYEVTNRDYMKFVRSGGYRKKMFWSDKGWKWVGKKKIKTPECMKDDRFNNPDYPIVCINWYEASAYTKWAGKRLPSEAEWERAAHGDENRLFPWGNDFSSQDGYRANYHPGDVTQDKDGYQFTAPVTAFPRGISPFGVFQMAGNVWEWCQDWYGEHYYAKSSPKNPSGPRTGSEKIVRGGAWLNSIISIRTVYRSYVDPKLRYSHIGLRCARSL